MKNIQQEILHIFYKLIKQHSFIVKLKFPSLIDSAQSTGGPISKLFPLHNIVSPLSSRNPRKISHQCVFVNERLKIATLCRRVE